MVICSIILISGAGPDFRGGSTLELQLQPSCKLKTKKGDYPLTIAVLHLSTNYISLFIITYIACYTTPHNNTVTVLLEYLDLFKKKKLLLSSQPLWCAQGIPNHMQFTLKMIVI